jgi:hypothetical protein
MLAVASRSYLWCFPIDDQIDASAVSSDTLTANIDLASARGFNLTGRTVRLRVDLQSYRVGATEGAYSGQDETVILYCSTNQSGNMQISARELRRESAVPGYENEVRFQHWLADSSSFSNEMISWTPTGATTATITGTVAGTGTRFARMLVSIELASV